MIIVDDVNRECINKQADKLLATKKYKNINVLRIRGYPHRIIQKIQI